MLNQKILHYQIFRKIGKSNCVTLFEAYEQSDTQKKVVVKIYDGAQVADARVRKNFEHLAKKLINVNHQYILKELEYQVTDKQLVIISQLLNGQNLKFAVLIKGLSQEEDLRIFRQIIEGVDFLHKQNIIHRDIKPENIFLIENYKKIKILDSGLAGVFDYDRPENISLRVDAPMFLSPEQAAGEKNIDERSDIYSLGVLLYFIYNRKLPFENTKSYSEILQQIIDQPVPEIPYKKDINTIIQKATQKNPAHRYQSCEEMLDAIEQLKL